MPTTTGLATSFITFSRPGASGGGATVTDRDGKIKWAGHNLLPNSESFDASSWSKTNVTVAANAVVAPDSTTTADRITFTVSSGQAIYTTSVNPAGVNYTGRVWLKGSGDVAIRISNSIDQQFLTSITLTSTWTLYTVTGTFNTTAGSLLFGVGGVTAASVDVWGAHLYRSDLGGMQLNPAQPAGMQSYYPTTPRNLLGWTEDFSNAAWGKLNIAAFGSGSIANAIIAPNGLQTADKIVASTATGYHQVTQAVAVGSGANTLTVYAKAAEYSLLHIAEGSNGFFQASFNLATGAVVAGSSGSKLTSTNIVSVGDGWYRCVLVITGVSATIQLAMTGYPAGATLGLYGAQYTGDGTSGIYLWGAQLSDSASLDTYVPQYGAAVTSAAYYAPRLDFDPVTLAARGLLVEEARTNLLLRSSEFSASAVWVVGNTTVTANTSLTTAPDGTNTADILVENGATDTHQIYNTASVVASTYTFSAYVKWPAGVTRNVYLRPVNDGTIGSNKGVIFNSSGQFVAFAGSIGSDPTYSAVQLGDGWWRFSVTAATSGSGTAYPTISLTNGTTLSYAGDSTSGLYLWGAQLEIGASNAAASFPTSLIPTGSATATRTADVASVSTGAFPYSASEGTIVANASVLSGATSGSASILYLYKDGTDYIWNWMWAGVAGTPRSQVVTSGSTVADLSSGTITGGTPFKNALTYKANDFAYTLNGGTVQTDTAGAVPAAAVRLSLGNQDGPYFMLNGYIRQITYIPRRLSNAELQSRSA